MRLGRFVWQSSALLWISLGVGAFTLTSCFDRSSHPREKADELRKDNKYDEAITEYEKHITYRLSVEDRPEWENPYIYLLDIGDLYLEQENVENALHYYELAEENGVKQGYVNDRYRYVASWYEEQGQLMDAIEHLKKYRERDPFLFNLMLDRLAKQLVREEEGYFTNREEPSPSPTSTPTKEE